VQKIWHHESRPNFARIGFLQIAQELDARQPALEGAVLAARTAGVEAAIKAAEKALGSNRAQSFNNKLDAVVTGFFLSLVVGIFLISVREWVLLVARKKAAEPRETPPTWLPDYAVVEGKPFKLFSFFALSLSLLKELSGEAAVDRAQQHRGTCSQMLEVDLLGGGLKQQTRGAAYAAAVEHRFEGPNRCC
jgi:carbon starvation protein